MKKIILTILALLMTISLMGCGKNSAEQEAKKQEVKALITKFQTFKGNASPNNVEDLYKDIKDILSPEMQKAVEEINIPNAKAGAPSHFTDNEITDIKYFKDIEYNGKEYEGYEVYSTYRWTEDESGKVVTFKSVSEVINYNGKLMITHDSDMEID